MSERVAVRPVRQAMLNPMLPVGLSMALSLFGDLTLYAVLVTQLKTLNITLAEVGILLSVHRLVRIPFNPLAGWIQDRVGRRGPFLLGLFLSVVSTAAYGLASGFWPLLIARVGWGAAWALINVGGITMALDLSAPSDRGRWIGMYNAWMWVGYALGPVVGSLLSDRFDFRTSMLVCSAISALGLAFATLRVVETQPSRTPATHIQEVEDKPDVQPAAQRGWMARILLIYSTNQFAVDGVILSTVTLLITQRVGTSFSLGGMMLGAASVGGILLAARSILAALLSPLVGRIADGTWGRKAVIAAGLAAGVVSFIILTLSTSFIAILLGVIIGALSATILIGVLPAALADAAPPGQLGRVTGQLATAGDIGSTIGPFLALSVAPILGLNWAYLLCATLFALGLILLKTQPKYDTIF